MKIAIASKSNEVSNHFGYCEGFTVFEIDKKKIIKKEFIPNPGHRPGFLPNFLNDIGTNIIISGGMGETAQQIFKQKNIEVVLGVEGNCEDVVNQYLSGSLKSIDSICKEHQHEKHCHQ